MLRALILNVALVAAVTVSANFATTANAAEDCGPGWWRGPGGFLSSLRDQPRMPGRVASWARRGTLLAEQGL
jgi:hypothetical protein